ncbi:unnamed protein product [Auanema sp. JU1783]|nr:unnamed protein product [Auanema sp. JU1783]
MSFREYLMGEVAHRRNHDDRSLRCNVNERSNNPAACYGPSSTLQKIMDSKEYFYHEVQQTDKMLFDNRRRSRLSRELQRRSEIERLRRKSVSLERIVPTPVIVDQFLVTLTMHVNRVEYFELTNPIGNGGSKLDNLAKISVESNTIVRLPDKDENDPYLTSQVTITGRLANVEKARLRIRECGLIDVMFPLSNVRPEVPMGSREEICHFLLQKELLRFIPSHLRVHIMDRNCLFKTFIVKIVGRTTDEKIINETIPKLLNIFYTPDVAAQIPLATQVDIPSCHRYLVFGHGEAVNNNLLAIAKLTNTSILFPATLYGDSPVFSCFILGEIDVLQKTRVYLQGLLPAQLSFTIYDSDLRYKRETDSTYKHFDRNSQVFLRVQPSELQPIARLSNDPLIHYFCLSTREYNVNRLYSVVDLTVRGSDSSKIPVPPTNNMFQQLIPLLSDPSLFLNFKSRADPKNFLIPPIRREVAPLEESRNETPVPKDPNIRIPTTDSDSCSLSQSSYEGSIGRPRLIPKVDDPVYPPYPNYRQRVQQPEFRYYNQSAYYGNSTFPTNSSGFRAPTSESFRTYSNGRLRPNDKRTTYGMTRGTCRFSPFTPNKSELSLKPKVKEDDEVYYALNDSEISAANQSIDGDKMKRFLSPKPNLGQQQSSFRNRMDEDNAGRYINQPPRLQPRREHHYEEKVQLRYRTTIPTEDDNITKMNPECTSQQVIEPPMSPSGESRRMNVMELIMKAAEEPQSVARNREMKESSNGTAEYNGRTSTMVQERQSFLSLLFNNKKIMHRKESYEQWDYV